MEREIIFRGKRVDNGEWVYGYVEFHLVDGDLTQAKRNAFITYDSMDKTGKVYRHRYEVGPATVGQYTGLRDRKRTAEYPEGQEIYDGDILRVKSGWYRSKKDDPNDRFDQSIKGITVWSVEYKIYNAEMGFYTFGIDRRWRKELSKSRLYNADAEIIGNKSDNPELLQEVTK